MSPREFTQADLDFTAFIAKTQAGTTPTGLRRQAWTEPAQVTKARAYEQETERLRALLHHERKTA